MNIGQPAQPRPAAEVIVQVSFLQQIFGHKRQREPLRPLYDRLVEIGRDPFWYREGRVPDTVDGRFDVIASVVALTLLRLEEEDPAGREPSALLTELFVDDMDSNLRQIGVGDYVVGKHISRLMGALGGRLGAMRQAAAAGGDFSAPVRRNVFHEAPPAEECVEIVSERLQQFRRKLSDTPMDALLAGRISS